MRATQFEYLQHPSELFVTPDRCNQESEATLAPLADFMGKVLDLLHEHGSEWRQQSSAERIENIVRALQEL